MSYYLQQWFRFLGVWTGIAVVAFTMLMAVVRTNMSQAISADLMVYSQRAYGQLLMRLYDPLTGINIPLLRNVDFITFQLSVDGHLAYAAQDQNGRSEIYVLDLLSADSTPINITQMPDEHDIPLAWSPDGRYLAFESSATFINVELFVWDAERAVNVTPHLDDGVTHYAEAWSFDGRLAFIPSYNRASGAHNEIYLWDGHSTSNLSQNPTHWHTSPTWSTAGQLAFLSVRDGYSVLIWDGVSFVDGAPDSSTFIHIAPDLTSYYSSPLTWTHNGQIAFEAQLATGTLTQIYVWDGQNAINISENPPLSNGSPVWSDDGRWAFSTFLSSQDVLYVRDAENNTLWSYNDGYQPHWLANGDLAFCQRGERGWILSVWNGFSVSNLVRGYDIDAQWQSGARIVCTSG